MGSILKNSELDDFQKTYCISSSVQIPIFQIQQLCNSGVELVGWPDSIACLINDSRLIEGNNNCKLLLNEKAFDNTNKIIGPDLFQIMSTQIIQPQEELFMNFADAFWKTDIYEKGTIH